MSTSLTVILVVFGGLVAWWLLPGLLMLGGAFLVFTGIIGLAVEQPMALQMFLLDRIDHRLHR